VCIRLYAGNSEYPALLARLAGSDNASGADNQQETRREAGILRDHTPDIRLTWMMRWSHLHGDMQRRCEENVQRVAGLVLQLSKVRAKFLVG
jgi:hypothetical protein